MFPETAQVENNAPDTITCVCGNSCGAEGMVQCDSEGIAYDLNNGPAAAGLAEMPDDPRECFMICPCCGRIYSDQTILDYNTAPVFRVVNPRAGAVGAALDLHADQS